MKVIGALFLLVGMWTIYELGIKGLTLTQAWTDVQKFFNLTPKSYTPKSAVPGTGGATSPIGNNGVYTHIIS